MTEQSGLLVRLQLGHNNLGHNDPGHNNAPKIPERSDTGLILLSGTSCHSSTMVDRGWGRGWRSQKERESMR